MTFSECVLSGKPFTSDELPSMMYFRVKKNIYGARVVYQCYYDPDYGTSQPVWHIEERFFKMQWRIIEL